MLSNDDNSQYIPDKSNNFDKVKEDSEDNKLTSSIPNENENATSVNMGSDHSKSNILQDIILLFKTELNLVNNSIHSMLSLCDEQIDMATSDMEFSGFENPENFASCAESPENIVSQFKASKDERLRRLTSIKSELKDIRDVLDFPRKESLDRHAMLLTELTQTPVRNLNVDDSNRPFTRSRGTAMELPNVQPRILKRKGEDR